MKNYQRIDRAETSLAHYDDRACEEAVIDLLTDLRHMCEASGWKFDELVRISEDNYIYENEEEGDND